MAEIVAAAKDDDNDLSKLDTWKRHGSMVIGHGSSFASGTMDGVSWLLNAVKDIYSSIQGIFFMAVLSIGCFVAYKFRARILMLLFETEEIKLSWQDVVWTILSCGGVCWPLEPLGRWLGLAYIAVEISEIQLGHLPSSGDVFVVIDISTNPLMNTRTINQSDGVFMRFKELFKVNVRKTDGPCVFKIMDQDILVHDQIAQVELNAWEFCNLAKQGSKTGKSGYYRFDLQHGEKRTKHAKGKHDGMRPYIAMRLREVTGDWKFGGFGTFAGMTGNTDARRTQRDFLETLNSQPGQTHFSLDPTTNELILP